MRQSEGSLAVVVPLCNEAQGLAALWARMRPALLETGRPYQVVFVDDGSLDGTRDALEELQAGEPDVRVVALSRNFGHQAALLAGLEHAEGDCIVAMDGDLQHPPELIPRLLQQWESGCDLVLTRRLEAPGTPVAKRLLSRHFYRVFRLLSGLDLEPGMADFWLIDRRVADSLLSAKERALFLRGMLQWVGFRRAIVEYRAEPRAAGRSKYGLGRMTGFARDGITGFSLVPLRLATVLGFVFAGLSFAYLVFAVLSVFLTSWNLPGWTSVIGSVLFLGGVQLICLGIIGEYVGQIFLEVKHRPRYVVDRLMGFARD